MEAKIKLIQPLILNWLINNWVNLIFLFSLIWLLLKIIELVNESPTDLTNWLLVYLTGIYALLTFFLAIVSKKAVIAAERSARAMEISINEARMLRLATHSAAIGFQHGYTYIENTDSSVMVEIQNLYEQPVIDLSILLWKTEIGTSGEREIKYSSMVRSDSINIPANQKEITVILKQTSATDSECRNLGTVALGQFMRFSQEPPKSALCLIVYFDRTTLAGVPKIFVYDLTQKPKSPLFV